MSPFFDTKLVKSILTYWKCKDLIFEFDHLQTIVGLKIKKRGPLSIKRIFTVYDSFLRFPRTMRNLDDILEQIHLFVKNNDASDVSVRIGYEDESPLSCELSKALYERARSAGLPFGFTASRSDSFGILDLTIPFEKYLKNVRHDGLRNDFIKGARRSFYDTKVTGKKIERGLFNEFVSRWSNNYASLNLHWKYTPEMLEALFQQLRSDKALLFSAVAKTDPKAYADVLVLHDGQDAYYYANTRNVGYKKFGGVCHYLHLWVVQYLMERGLRSYNLGFIANKRSLGNKEKGVRRFKKDLSTHEIPLVVICKKSFLARMMILYWWIRKQLKKYYARKS